MEALAKKTKGRQPAIAHPQRDRAYARTVVLDAARHLFRKFPYEDISLEQIAAAACVTRHTLKNHFVSKEEIYRLTREKLLADLGELVIDDVSNRLTAEQGLRAFLDNCFLIFSDPRYGELYLSMIRDRTDHVWLKEACNRQIRGKLLRVGETFVLYKSQRPDMLASGPKFVAEQLMLIAEGLAAAARKAGASDRNIRCEPGHLELAARAFAALLELDAGETTSDSAVGLPGMLRSISH